MLPPLVSGLLAALVANVALPPPPPGRCLSDAHGALDSGSAARLEQICERLDRAGGGQLAIAVVDEGDTGELDRNELAEEIFKSWGVGHKGRDDGLLIVLKTGSPGHRWLKIETGYGLEGALPDGKVMGMVDALALPQLRAGRYGEGLVPLAEAIGAAMQKEASTGAVERRAQEKKQQARQMVAAGAVFGGLVLALIAWALALFSLRVARRVPGRLARLAGLGLLGGGALAAVGGGGPFKGPLLLSWGIFAGLGALAWGALDRHRCPRCGSWKAIDSEVLRSPTYWSDGVALVSETCASCGYQRRFRRPLARRVRTVVVGGGFGGGGGGWGSGGGGGDSGFGGFGGGSSGGGGGSRDF